VSSRKARAVASRPLRLIAALALLALSAGVAGCSGDDEVKPPAGALARALSYLPADTGAVVVVDTDVRSGSLKRLDELGSRLRSWGAFKKALKADLARQGLDFDELARPQLGNPLALGVDGDGRRIGAIHVRDPDRLERALDDRVSAGTAKRLDDFEGSPVWSQTRLHQAPAFAATRNGDLVLAGSREALEAAIDAARSGENVASQRASTAALSRLGPGHLVRAVGDAQRLLEAGDPGGAPGPRRVPWIRALGRFTLVADVRRDLTIDLRLQTNRARLSKDDLPIAAGRATPLLHDLTSAAAIGVRHPDQLARFVERTLELTAPDQSARYTAAVGQLRTFFGVDLHRDLLSKISNLSVALGPGTAITFEGKLVPGSAGGVVRALERSELFIQGVVREILPGARVERRGDGPVWVITRSGLVVGRYAVKNNVLVGSIGFGGLPDVVQGKRLPGAIGALSLRSDSRRTGQLIAFVPGVPKEAADILSRLGQFSLNVRADTSGVTVRARVRVGQGVRRGR
jgi:hypothetical protein